VDFPQSAEKLLYFFEKGQQTADGVISATPQLFEDLLRITGPIAMPDYGVTLTADNFQSTVQFKTSEDYDKTLNQPKKMLDDFAPLLLNRLTNLGRDQWLMAFQIFENNLRSRQILIYSKDKNTEKKIVDLGFSGQILNTDHDYLGIFNTNLGGTKTDLSTDQSAQLNSKILSDGSIVNSLSLNRDNFTKERNKDYLRILVPAGSQFLSATGFDDHTYLNSSAPGLNTDPDLAEWDKGKLFSNVFVRTEASKTEFAGWVTTEAGQSRTITIEYALPFKISDTGGYSLLVQKQAGSKPFTFTGQIDLGNFKPTWIGPDVKLSSNIIKFSSNSNTDDFWPLIVSK